MRHRNKKKSLSRTSSHRRAMLSNMACSIILHKRIKTTVAKAKVLRSFVEPIITKSKIDSTHSRRVVFSKLKNKEAVTELFSNISEKVSSRPGGYTRIIKLGKRLGDSAEMCFIELVDFNDTYQNNTDDKKKTRRSRRSKSTANKQDNVSDKTKSNLDTKSEEASAKEVSAEENPVEESPAEEASTEEAPAEEVSAEETPAEETPAEETPAEETPAEETPAEEKKDKAEDK